MCYACSVAIYREQWYVGVSAVVFVMELSPCILLLDAQFSLRFWLIVALQEANALLRNLGLYYALYCRISHSILGDLLTMMQKKRQKAAAARSPPLTTHRKSSLLS